MCKSCIRRNSISQEIRQSPPSLGAASRHPKWHNSKALISNAVVSSYPCTNCNCGKLFSIILESLLQVMAKMVPTPQKLCRMVDTTHRKISSSKLRSFMATITSWHGFSRAKLCIKVSLFNHKNHPKKKEISTRSPLPQTKTKTINSLWPSNLTGFDYE